MTAYPIISPNTGAAIGTWYDVGDAEIAAALKTVPRAMAQLASLEARRDALKAFIDAIRVRTNALVEATHTEVGKRPAEAADEVEYAVSFLETSLDLLNDYRFTNDLGDGRTVREVPRGAGLLIAPFNDPIAGLTRKIGPCLAAGAAALVKPSEHAMKTALVLADAARDAGLGEVVQTLAIGDHTLTHRLIDHPSVGTVSFTGSTAVGRALATRAAGSFTSFVGELGGTNPFIILNDADLDIAVADALSRKIKAAGQACSAQNVVFVEEGVAEAVDARIIDAFSAIQAGPATDEVQLGPVRTKASVERLAELESDLVRHGGRKLTGGIVPAQQGPFVVQPTAYRVSQGHGLEEHEAFGPLLAVEHFSDRAALQARLAANHQPLVLYVYGTDLAAVRDLIAPLCYGSVGINTTKIQSPRAPTGGFADAGIGREGGSWGLAPFLTTINTVEYP